MLEGVLDKRDEEQGGHGDGGWVLGGEGDVDVLGQPYLHQVDVALQELHFLFPFHFFLLVVVEHVAQHLRQLLNGILCSFAVERGQGIDVVERVQQEVGAYLVAQVAQFGLGACRLGLQACLFRFVPALG